MQTLWQTSVLASSVLVSSLFVFSQVGCSPGGGGDAGLLDAGDVDAGGMDAGPALDSGLPDAGARDAGAPPGGDAGGTSDGGTLANRRDQCDGPEDCGGAACMAIPDQPGATRVCVGAREVPQRSCAPDAGPGDWPGACCTHDGCTLDGGTPGFCVDFQVGYCGGAPPPEVNTCRYDACQTDADCGNQRACVPAGAYGRVTSLCVDMACATDEDCNARAGGECRALFFGECGAIGGFSCTYADDPCREDRDCPVDEQGYPQVCQPRQDHSGTVCVPVLLAP